ncbi:MAG: lytic transglycosylase domain-containing protein [Kiritimatiellae bacterium]|nr:lytic transglycosylase domain-containing protein [Kiritimatiellia bacterium]
MVGKKSWAGWMAVFFGVGICLSGVARGQDVEWDEQEVDEWVRQGAVLVQTLHEEYEVDWELVGEWVTRALQSEEWQSLVDVDAAAEQLYAMLKTVPGAAGQVDWLRQRMDYLDMAAWVMRAEGPLPTPKPRRFPTPRAFPTGQATRVWPTPTPRAAATAAPVKVANVRQGREKAVGSMEHWKKALAKRSVPARAEVLIPRLKAIFREEGIPENLVWLAEVESSLNPLAKSPVGAAGLFQFMPATAERFGMRVKPEDERLDPEKSARAAAQYLRILYGRFDDWPLSLAAYNAGEGRVGRVLRERKATCFDEIADHLPVETRMYVPKIMAVIALREGGGALPLSPL